MSATASNAQEPAAAEAQPLPIVLVDDDPAVLKAIAEWLERYGHRVAAFEDASGALEFIAKNRVEIVIIDVLMPRIDGLEVLMRLGRTRPEIKVLAISGEGRIRFAQLLEVAEHLGACRTLAKPFSGGQIVALVDEMLDRGSGPAAT